MCAGVMGAGGDNIFRLLCFQKGKGHRSKHAFCKKGATSLPGPGRCLFSLEAVPRNWKWVRSLPAPRPEALPHLPFLCRLTLHLGVSSLPAKAGEPPTAPYRLGAPHHDPTHYSIGPCSRLPVSFSFPSL